MDKTTTLDASPLGDAEYATAIDGYLRELEKISSDVEARQRRIDKLQAETKAMLAQITQVRST